jgi:molecular chaperone GrpE
MPEELNEDQAPEAEAAEAEDIEALKQALAEEKKKAEANLVGWQRAQADFINYKRRAEQEKEDICKFANTELLCCILPVLDDLERAFTASPSQSDKTGWIDGIRLITRKLRASLEAQGLCPIEALGHPFDPNLHQAMREDKGKEGIVIEEVERGYTLHDRVIRPSKVVVGNSEEEEKEK